MACRLWDCASGTNLRGKSAGFTLVEMLVVVAIIMLLLSIMMPSLNRAKEIGKAARCRAHLQELSYGHISYATDNGGRLPGMYGSVAAYQVHHLPWGAKSVLSVKTGHLWTSGALRSEKAWLCPSTRFKSPFEWYKMIGEPTQGRTDPWTFHFTYNYRVTLVPEMDDLAPGEPGYGNGVRVAAKTEYDGCRRLATFANLSTSILLAEENTGWISPSEIPPPSMGGPKQVINDPMFVNPDVSEPRHLGNSQVGYLDGHAEQIPPRINLTIRQFEDYWPKPQH